MTFATLIRRSLRFHARAHFGVVLGAAVGSAALIGALLVGDSVRESLRQRALQRLPHTFFALTPSDRVFTRDLVSRFTYPLIQPPQAGSGSQITIQPHANASQAEVLSLSGTAQVPSGDSRANQVQVFGVDEDFWAFVGTPISKKIQKGFVTLNQTLADQLHAHIGDEVVIRVGAAGGLSAEAAVSQRRGAAKSLRLKVAQVLTPEAGGDLDFSGRSLPPANAFIDGEELSDHTDLRGKANTVLTGPIAPGNLPPASGIAKYVLEARLLWNRLLFSRQFSPPPTFTSTEESLKILNSELQNHWKLEDAGLKLEYVPDSWGLELRSPRVFLDPPVEAAAAAIGGDKTIRILSYLANLITTGANATPYSMVCAADPPFIPTGMPDDEIVLNQWLADDLHAKPGDSVDLSFFLPESGAKLAEATNRFRIHSIVPLELPWADRTLMPEFPGIENAESTRDWDAGFPLVYKIRPKDEQYWKERRGTPKAFITFAAGQKMWGNRFGNVTAIRFPTPAGMPTGEFWSRFKDKLLTSLKPEEVGLRFEPIRDRALKAAEQSQDFGGLFIGFSIFLVVAALLLMALLFQFGLEQRVTEIGTLLALGFAPKQVRRLFLLEGSALALVGGVIGALGGLGYAKAMIWALTTLWRSAVANSSLQFHATTMSLLIGTFASLLVAILTIWITLRKQARQPARELLSGEESQLRIPTSQSRSRGTWIALAAGCGAVGIVAWALATGEHSNAEAFFSAGALLLIAGLGAVAAWFARLGRRADAADFTLASLGVRGCARRRKRSISTVALLACGSFVISSIGVFRLDAKLDETKRTSGTGGFALIGESTLPVVHDLNTRSGREFFGLDDREMADVNVLSFRVHEGDEASCLNLNRAQKPRLLGANPESLTGRFTFSGAAKGFDLSKTWQLLKTKSASDDVPAIGDANSIQWALGKKLGDTIDYTDERGRSFKLRLVGAVANSILQGSLIIDETEFVKRFPGESGFRMFLMDAPAGSISNVSAALTRGLQDLGLELIPTEQRLNAFNAVQNTYLGTFQILGGLGLLLGSAGLGVVVLRNVLERRGELGLLIAVGFRRRSLFQLILGEHAALLGLGLALGICCAVVAVLPALIGPGTRLPYVSLTLTLGAVLLNGGLWTWLAARYALRGNLLAALRNE